MTKKNHTEAERDLLAKNHKRLNKAINDLLDENQALRKGMEVSIREINNLRDRLAEKNREDQAATMHMAVHCLAGRMDLTSDQVAERAIAIAGQVQRRMAANDVS